MLNQFHKDFLKHLVDYNVDFLVIGGQCAVLHGIKAHTCDLDIWAPFTGFNKFTLENALTSFDRDFLGFVRDYNIENNSTNNMYQIHIPNCETIYNSNKEKIYIGKHNKIDLLNKILDFDFIKCRLVASRFPSIKGVNMLNKDIYIKSQNYLNK